ncbi:MAG: hypothetical protein WCL04_03950 [Verrucomicrobiota bacterium]
MRHPAGQRADGLHLLGLKQLPGEAGRLGLGFPAAGDVTDRALVIKRLAAPAAGHACIFGDPNRGAVVTANFILKVPHLAVAFDHRLEALAHGGVHIDVARDVTDGSLHLRHRSITIETGQCGIDAQIFSGRRALVGALDGVIKETAVFLLGGTQGLFGGPTGEQFPIQPFIGLG